MAGRWMYRVLLRLHPSDFRTRFGGEMLLVFEEAVEGYGEWWLVGKLGVSLVRQRVLRTAVEGEICATEECVGLMAGTYPAPHPPHLTWGKVSLAFVLSLLLAALVRPF